MTIVTGPLRRFCCGTTFGIDVPHADNCPRKTEPDPRTTLTPQLSTACQEVALPDLASPEADVFYVPMLFGRRPLATMCTDPGCRHALLAHRLDDGVCSVCEAVLQMLENEA